MAEEKYLHRNISSREISLVLTTFFGTLSFERIVCERLRNAFFGKCTYIRGVSGK